MYISVAKAILELNRGPITFPSEQLIHGHVQCSAVTSGQKLDSKFLWLCLHVLAKLTSSLLPRWRFPVNVGCVLDVLVCRFVERIHLVHGLVVCIVSSFTAGSYIGTVFRICCKSWCSWILKNLGSRYPSRNPRRNGAAKLP